MQGLSIDRQIESSFSAGLLFVHYVLLKMISLIEEESIILRLRYTSATAYPINRRAGTAVEVKDETRNGNSSSH